jgi:hypothetical protein
MYFHKVNQLVLGQGLLGTELANAVLTQSSTAKTHLTSKNHTMARSEARSRSGQGPQDEQRVVGPWDMPDSSALGSGSRLSCPRQSIKSNTSYIWEDWILRAASLGRE